ncbi:survival motor neuron protein 1 [Ictalurus punctatus]|uniref:Survival motor neuron protein 1 n=1 Tax=Ictalurus punctatus TaxID=7998 RepID=E3TFQ3_ICTPU|nr:survival motor neuron protein 1 [Ictalurus punctatus]ADO29139.1 survival motor neuron protein 1 [Ictalurus punctatus]
MLLTSSTSGTSGRTLLHSGNLLQCVYLGVGFICAVFMANGTSEVVFCRGTGQSDDSDIWDDTALIKAYDKAVASFKNALKGEDAMAPHTKEKPGNKRKNNKKSKSRKKSNTSPEGEWNVGDACYAYWSADGNLYAATISSVDLEKGTCVVYYNDYGNEEEQNLSDLLTDAAELDGESQKMADGKEVESSTEETDRSSTPHQSNQQKHKAKGKAPVVPPMWGPGFPPFPPPGSHFRMSDSRRAGGSGPSFPGWSPMMPPGPPMIPPPPPISPDMLEDDEALGSMLISWYMSGYHTGYYLGLKQGRKEAAAKKSHYK